MNKLDLGKTPSGAEAVRRITKIENEFLLQQKRQHNCELLYALTGDRPNFVHEVTVRFDAKGKDDAILIEKLYKQIYG